MGGGGSKVWEGRGRGWQEDNQITQTGLPGRFTYTNSQAIVGGPRFLSDGVSVSLSVYLPFCLAVSVRLST